MGTGNKLAVYVGDTLVQQYEIVVYGDINGDGKVSNLDLVLMQKQILGIESQSGSRLEAANVSKDGGISNKDLVILQKHILGPHRLISERKNWERRNEEKIAMMMMALRPDIRGCRSAADGIRGERINICLGVVRKCQYR